MPGIGRSAVLFAGEGRLAAGAHTIKDLVQVLAAGVAQGISSVGCCRSGTMTVTAPEACPARTPLKLSSSTMLPDAPEQALDEYPMPDPMLTLDDLEKCGYRDGDMLPLSKERAMELYERDLTVYAVVDGGSAEMLFDWEELALLSVDRKRK